MKGRHPSHVSAENDKLHEWLISRESFENQLDKSNKKLTLGNYLQAYLS
jgi:hypothetical protein